MVLHGSSDDAGFRRLRHAGQANQNHPNRGAMLAENQLAEVLVGRNKQRIVRVRTIQHGFVRNPWCHFPHTVHVVPVVSKPIGDLAVNALVEHKDHPVFATTG